MTKILVSALIFVWTVSILATGPDLVWRDFRALREYVQYEIPSLVKNTLQKK